MTTESLPLDTRNLPPHVAAALAQLQRENERLRRRNEQLDEQTRALLVLQEIANTLSAELRLPQLLRRVVVAAVRLTGAEVSALYLIQPDGRLTVEAIETAQSAAGSGSFAGDLARLDSGSQPEGDLGVTSAQRRLGALAQRSVAGWAAAHAAPALVTDPENDPRFEPDEVAVDSQMLGVSLGCVAAVPMIFNGVVTGVLEVGQSGEGQTFDPPSLDRMRTLAAQAATAVTNAQLYKALRAERDRIIQTQEDERKRLGRDLHDGPAQRLAQIAMSLEHATQLAQHEPDHLIPELQAIREKALATTREIRNLLFDLRPLALDAESGGLVVALEQFIQRFKDEPGPELTLRAHYPQRLSHNVELTVFAIVQEAVNNVLKHAHATTCRIDIRETDDKLVACVTDDGDGFDPHAVETEYEQRGSWGLVNMLERAALIEGKLTLASQPGKGARLTLEVPRRPSLDADEG